MPRGLAAVAIALVLCGPGGRALAGPRVTPIDTLAPACQAFMTGVLARDDPGALPVVVLADPAPKAGPYEMTVGGPKIGGVRVDTVLTGWMEFQDGASRARTPFFCLGRGRKVGFYYACQRSDRAPDRAVLPVRECHAASPGDPAGATACLRTMFETSETALAAAATAARVKATRAGAEAMSNFQASEREFISYRTRSCDVFRAPDASTDAMEFLVGCVVRLNVMRTQALRGALAR